MKTKTKQKILSKLGSYNCSIHKIFIQRQELQTLIGNEILLTSKYEKEGKVKGNIVSQKKNCK